jgi:DNA-binding NtrC family response regulator
VGIGTRGDGRKRRAEPKRWCGQVACHRGWRGQLANSPVWAQGSVVDSDVVHGFDDGLKERRRMDKETVLIVDDEEMVLTSLSTYLTLETDYEVVTFTSAARALEHIEANDVGIIISDFLMPDMDGITFLAKAKDLRPDAPRVILTGYADKENAIKAINQVGLYQYVEKPWDNDDLRLIIRNGLERKQLLDKLNQKVIQINQAYSELQSIQQEILKAFA